MTATEYLGFYCHHGSGLNRRRIDCILCFVDVATDLLETRAENEVMRTELDALRTEIDGMRNGEIDAMRKAAQE